MHSPTENYWSAVKRILRYLQGNADYGLRIMHDSGTILHANTDSAYNSLTGFSDADWLVAPTTVDPLGDMLSILVRTSCHGPLENKRLSLGRQQSLSTRL